MLQTNRIEKLKLSITLDKEARKRSRNRNYDSINVVAVAKAKEVEIIDTEEITNIKINKVKLLLRKLHSQRENFPQYLNW